MALPFHPRGDRRRRCADWHRLDAESPRGSRRRCPWRPRLHALDGTGADLGRWPFPILRRLRRDLGCRLLRLGLVEVGAGSRPWPRQRCLASARASASACVHRPLRPRQRLGLEVLGGGDVVGDRAVALGENAGLIRGSATRVSTKKMTTSVTTSQKIWFGKVREIQLRHAAAWQVSAAPWAADRWRYVRVGPFYAMTSSLGLNPFKIGQAAAEVRPPPVRKEGSVPKERLRRRTSAGARRGTRRSRALPRRRCR